MFQRPPKREKLTPSQERAARCWFSLATMADIFAMTKQGFHTNIRPLIAPADINTENREVKIRARGAIDALLAKRLSQAAAKAADPLLAGGDSEALERYRRLRGDLVELEIHRQRGMLIPRDKLAPSFSTFASAIRKAGEKLELKFGADARDILVEALDDAEAAVRRSIQESGATP
jgi:hypothetical protein